MPSPAALMLRALDPLRPLLQSRPAQTWLKAQVARRVTGPDEAARARYGSHVWGEARNRGGQRRVARLQTANGYDVTVHGALLAVRRLLAYAGPGGYFTPTQLWASVAWRRCRGPAGSRWKADGLSLLLRRIAPLGNRRNKRHGRSDAFGGFGAHVFRGRPDRRRERARIRHRRDRRDAAPRNAGFRLRRHRGVFLAALDAERFAEALAGEFGAARIFGCPTAASWGRRASRTAAVAIGFRARDFAVVAMPIEDIDAAEARGRAPRPVCGAFGTADRRGRAGRPQLLHGVARRWALPARGGASLHHRRLSRRHPGGRRLRRRRHELRADLGHL